MALPVIEMIARNVLETVAGVRESMGFNYTLIARRHSRAGDRQEHLHVTIVQEDPEEVPDPKIPNTNEWFVTFSVAAYIVPPLEDPTPIDQYANLIVADLELALMADRYRGNNALDTRILPHQTIAAEGLQYECAVIKCRVNYRTSELDPYVNAK